MPTPFKTCLARCHNQIPQTASRQSTSGYWTHLALANVDIVPQCLQHSNSLHHVGRATCLVGHQHIPAHTAHRFQHCQLANLVHATWHWHWHYKWWALNCVVVVITKNLQPRAGK
jgi:hypothetical protein